MLKKSQRWLHSVAKLSVQDHRCSQCELAEVWCPIYRLVSALHSSALACIWGSNYLCVDILSIGFIWLQARGRLYSSLCNHRPSKRAAF